MESKSFTRKHSKKQPLSRRDLSQTNGKNSNTPKQGNLSPHFPYHRAPGKHTKLSTPSNTIAFLPIDSARNRNPCLTQSLIQWATWPPCIDSYSGIDQIKIIEEYMPYAQHDYDSQWNDPVIAMKRERRRELVDEVDEK